MAKHPTAGPRGAMRHIAAELKKRAKATKPAAPRLKPGMWCHFVDGKGKVRQGIYRGDRNVEVQLSPLQMGNSFEIPIKVITAPPSATIHVGKPKDGDDV